MDSIRLDPPRPELAARHLDQLIDKWLEEQRVRVSARTMAGYAEKIGYFRRWWAATGPTCNWILTERQLRAFNKYLDGYISQYGRKLAYNTKKDILRRLRQMFFWAKEKDHIVTNVAVLVPPPEGSAPARQAAPLDCLRKLIEAAEQSPYPTRDRAMLAVMLGAGVRRSECASINIETIVIDADGGGQLQVTGKRVRGREVEVRTVAFDRATGIYIAAHYDSTLSASGPFFASRRGPRLTPMGVYKAVKRVIQLAGLTEQIQGCHDLRRYFATYYTRSLRGEAYAHLLSKQMGHSAYRMTAQYSLQDVEDIKEVLISPFALLANGPKQP